jgi:hypothetical protein
MSLVQSILVRGACQLSNLRHQGKDLHSAKLGMVLPPRIFITLELQDDCLARMAHALYKETCPTFMTQSFLT